MEEEEGEEEASSSSLGNHQQNAPKPLWYS
jgi:hypothetical protein